MKHVLQNIYVYIIHIPLVIGMAVSIVGKGGKKYYGKNIPEASAKKKEAENKPKDSSSNKQTSSPAKPTTEQPNLKYYYDAQGRVIGVEDLVTGESRAITQKTYQEQTYQPVEPMSPAKPNIEPQKPKDKFTKKDAARQKRVEELIKREERLETFKEAIYERTGIEAREGESKTARFFKAAARSPVEIVTAPISLGGRIGLAGEAATYKEGRKELTRARKETPKAALSSVDPRTPEGLVGLGFAALGVRGVAKARQSALAQKKGFEVTTEKGVTSRVTRLEPQPQKAFRAADIRDVTKAVVEGKLGKKVYKGKTEISTEFYKIGKNKFSYKGSGETIIGKTKTFLETKGLVRPRQAVGYTKATTKGKVTEYGSVSRTRQLAKNPFEISRTDTMTGRIGKKGLKDVQKSVGYDIERFRKEISSESGKPIAREQTIQTQKAGISEKTLSKYYERTPKVKAENLAGAREQYLKQYRLVKPKTITETAPQRTGTILAELKQQVTQQAKVFEVRQSLVNKRLAQVSLLRQEKVKAVQEPVLEKPKQTQTLFSKEIEKTKEKAMEVQKTQQLTIPVQDQERRVRSITRPKTEELKAIKTPVVVPKEKTGTKAKTTPATKPAELPKELQAPKQVTTPITEPVKPVTPIVPPLPPPPLTPGVPILFPPVYRLGFAESRGKPGLRAKPTTRQYAPSLLGIALGRKAQRTTNLSGLEIRGVQSSLKKETPKSFKFGGRMIKPMKDGISMKFKVIKPKKKAYESVGDNMIKRMRSVRMI